MLDKVGSLWIGKSLSNVEKLSMSSFVANGHDYHLYVYDDVEGIPEGVIIDDANKVVPEKDIFYSLTSDGKPGGLGAFSDYFRFNMMNYAGGYWVDTDIVCIKPFDFDTDYVFSSENTHRGEIEATSGVMKIKKGSKALKYAVDYCNDVEDKSNIRWGDIGPLLVRKTIEKFKLEKYVRDYKVFMPINWWEAHHIINPNTEFQIENQTHSIHFWNEIWRSQNWDKNLKYDDSSVFEQLKKWVGIK